MISCGLGFEKGQVDICPNNAIALKGVYAFACSCLSGGEEEEVMVTGLIEIHEKGFNCKTFRPSALGSRAWNWRGAEIYPLCSVFRDLDMSVVG
jgi:hypothetical protein